MIYRSDQQHPTKINFKCPSCMSKVDLKDVVEKKGQFGCIDCVKELWHF